MAVAGNRPRADTTTTKDIALIPINTTLEDLDKLLGYLNKQVGWIETSKAKKSLGEKALDDRKLGAMGALNLIQRDGTNLRLSDIGERFAAGDTVAALREAIMGYDLYRETVEWIHYGQKTEVTAAEVGQYWHKAHDDTVAGANGERLKGGAVLFGRVLEGAELGQLTIGRGGKQTRINVDLASVDSFLHPENHVEHVAEDSELPSIAVKPHPEPTGPMGQEPEAAPMGAPQQLTPTVTANPSVHVNVEIHIAADATAETVREIFKNMARYILDKPVDADEG